MNTSVTRAPSIYRPVAQALDECSRELQVRKRCYDRWVAEGKLTESEARDRFERLASACFYLDQMVSDQLRDAAKAIAETVCSMAEAEQQSARQSAAG